MQTKCVSSGVIRSLEIPASGIMRRSIGPLSLLMLSLLSACSGQPAVTESTGIVRGTEQEGSPAETPWSFEDSYKNKYGDKWEDIARDPEANAEPNTDAE